MSTTLGDQVPDIPFREVTGNVGAVSPLHIGAGDKNVGVIIWLTVTSMVVVVAHCPESGVNVYDADWVLSIIDGDHVPDMLLLDVVGKLGAVLP